MALLAEYELVYSVTSLCKIRTISVLRFMGNNGLTFESHHDTRVCDVLIQL